jgi:hypothetical protein
MLLVRDAKLSYFHGRVSVCLDLSSGLGAGLGGGCGLGLGRGHDLCFSRFINFLSHICNIIGRCASGEETNALPKFNAKLRYIFSIHFIRLDLRFLCLGLLRGLNSLFHVRSVTGLRASDYATDVLSELDTKPRYFFSGFRLRLSHGRDLGFSGLRNFLFHVCSVTGLRASDYATDLLLVIKTKLNYIGRFS